MPKLIKKRSGKAGLPPGTLIHIGEKRVEAPKITVIDYDESRFEEGQLKTIDECFIFKDRPTTTWINVDGVHHVEILEKLGECYGIHPLALEDILNTDQRPKMEDYGEYLYIVVRALDYKEPHRDIETEQISFIVGANFVFSFQEREGDSFEPVRERIRNNKGRIRKMGADYLAYTLIDSIVDSYFIILEKVGERIEFLEEELVTRATPVTLRTIHELKRQMIFLRRAVWPLREVIGSLERQEAPLVQESTRVFLRDVYDHTIQVIDTVETLRDIVSGMLDIYLSSVSNRLNSVMKVLTIIATIFMPLTFLAGVYGMNFKYFPELNWKWSYPAFWFAVIFIGVLMLFFFKRKNWI